MKFFTSVSSFRSRIQRYELELQTEKGVSMERPTRFDEAIQARISEKMLDRLDQVAARLCQTRSGVVRDLILRGLDRMEKGKPGK